MSQKQRADILRPLPDEATQNILARLDHLQTYLTINANILSGAARAIDIVQDARAFIIDRKDRQP